MGKKSNWNELSENKHSEGVIRRCKDIHRQVDTTITERREGENGRNSSKGGAAAATANERMAMAVVGIVWPSMAGLVQRAVC